MRKSIAENISLLTFEHNTQVSGEFRCMMALSNSIGENLAIINEKIKKAYDGVPNNPNVKSLFL